MNESYVITEMYCKFCIYTYFINVLKEMENEEMAATVTCVDALLPLCAVISVLIRSSVSLVTICTTGTPNDRAMSEK
jgi:hypothetical protein